MYPFTEFLLAYTVEIYMQKVPKIIRFLLVPIAWPIGTLLLFIFGIVFIIEALLSTLYEAFGD